MWKKILDEIMGKFGAVRCNGKVASERTQTLTKEVVSASIRRLHELGYKIQDPRNLGERHIFVLVNDSWHTKHKKIKTVQNELSRLRVFCTMLGKPGMVGPLEKYLPNVDPKLLVVRTAALTSKSWSEHGIDLVSKFQEIDERDLRLGLMLRLELGFGLRREEVLKCDPHTQDFGHYLQVFPGQGKGGRWRNIPIISEAQRATLDFVKSRVPKNQALGWEYAPSGKVASLDQNIRRYENLMAALGFTKADAGVTGHGLRAQFAENHSLLLGMMPPTLGGLPGQMARDELQSRQTRLAQALGHDRNTIVNAYVGSFGNNTTIAQAESAIEHIKRALNLIETANLPPVTIERMRDCFRIQDLMAALGVQISHVQVHELWQARSRRHGVAWMKPEHEIGVALEVEALALMKQFSTKKEGE
ncbi:Glycerol-3-phosphate cytidylyltransferase, cytidylyltransferase family [Collimonas sp. OK607]|uniref:phage integrase N-terminal domain-containing protein n=1 Tax=Collimonas sp. OK607 TaxID=1798194 RepID=UPI0008F2A8B6|nr:phage integrase N-terminal domain-containing protein [Collimonas sp. OK607]SFB27950.1 Glycerol-3-phosphate cytidylyltransferase, cytidylyltransferase family [Collimonas sp. OK607]